MNKGDRMEDHKRRYTSEHKEQSSTVRCDDPAHGSGSHAGMLVTKTLLFSGEGLTGRLFRAIDKKTGDSLGNKDSTGGTQTGLPMTYMHNGRQYIVLQQPLRCDRVRTQLVAYTMPAGGAPARGGGPREVVARAAQQ
jgi:quinoprotein glucose dehydrogenase